MNGVRHVRSSAGRHDNNFNLLRMIAASAVLVSHAYPIALGTGAPEPLSSILNVSLGTVAVLVFFAISGFFISKSFAERRNCIEFWTARVLRIYPALLAAIFASVVLIGPLCGTKEIRGYFLNWDVCSYVVRNLMLIKPQDHLPGVFATNPYPYAVNGSLWTLFYECTCYGLVALTSGLGLTADNRRFVAFLSAYLAWYLIGPLTGLDEVGRIRNLHDLSLPFVMGMAFYHFRQYLPLKSTICGLLGALVILTHGHPWFDETLVLFLAYVTFYLGYLPVRPLKAYNRLGDYSYGMYLYAFPCEQVGATMFKGISPIGLIAISYPVVLACAVVSWHVLEKCALAQRTEVARQIVDYAQQLRGGQIHVQWSGRIWNWLQPPR